MKNKILDQIQARNKIYVGNMNNLIYPNDRRIIGTQEPLDEYTICFKYRQMK